MDEYMIVGEPVHITKGTDLEYLFGKSKRKAGVFRASVIENIYNHLTHTGAMWKVKIESTNGDKPARAYVDKKFNQIRTALREEAKGDPLWEPDDHGRYVRSVTIEDDDGVAWLWLQRLGPKLPIQSTSIDQ